ncbi:MAG: PAS domain S-box protein [Proteobacteria bacterium]|nr:PAS domain S-box protein [Pseudomonadota bacterium]MBU1583507.1 PAS domain S-box protein [Pseudomonadota bacterium]MBU2628302.1 PAS domain S-box protein [Pseudomonadota bacterium]
MNKKPTYEQLEKQVKALKIQTAKLKQAEKIIKSQNQLLNTLMDNLQVGVFMVAAPSGKPLLANKCATELLGKGIMNHADKDSLAQVYNAYKSGTDELYPKDQMPIVKGLFGENHHIDDMVVLHPDGSKILLEVFGNSIKDSQGNITGSLVSFFDITKHKQMEQDLVKYREAVDNSPDLIYRTDMSGVIVFISPSVYRLSGYTVKEALGMKMAEEVYAVPAERNTFLELLSKTGSVKNFEARLQRKDKSIWWASTNAQFYRDEHGNILGVEGVSRDVTDLKLAEAAFKKSEEKYRRLADNAVDMIYRLRLPEGVYEYVSPAVKKIFGYTPEEIYRSPFLFRDAIHPDFNDYVQKHWDNMVSGTIPPFYEYKILHRSGEEKWLNQRAVLILDEKGQPAAMEGIVTDITLRKQMERQLKESKKQYKQLSDATFEAIFLSEKGICVGQNMSAQKMFGYSDIEAIGRFGTDWIHPDYRETVIQRMLSGSKEAYQSLALRKDGTTFPCEIQARMLRQEGKSIRITALRDITDRIKAEKEKQAAQKVTADQTKHAMVGQLAGKMAHDFNNVLGVIMGNAQLSMINCNDPDMYKTLELIYEQTVRGKNLTKNLVAFAKDQEPKQDYFKINEKIDLVLTLLKRDLEGIELIKDDKPGVPEVLADPGMIEHALVNLIQNSIHATSLTPSPRIWVRTYSLDNWICFDIEDNGCGIPDEHMENIFEPSFTLKGQRDIINAYDRTIKGTGYGMSNVKKYIEQHKGSITVQSKPGSGTSFTVRLPVLEKELTKKEKKLIRVSLPQTGKYILLVEDEQAISDVQYRVLTGPPFNHKVGLATNGQVAIDLFDRNPYDFISLDYLLPGKLNGMDVYHYVRQKNTTIPILFISGNIEFLESIKELKQKDPNIDHLSKPCRNLDYVETINKLMIKTLPKNK